MKELISVIVPIYKVEKYLRRCVDSIINQTYKNLEIILVDDGNSDGCPQICDEYAKKDKRIKVIHRQYEGVASARNAGLDICKGEYICFVDSDDYVSAYYVEKMYKAIIENEVDIVVCETQLVDENDKHIVNNNFSVKEGKISFEEGVKRVFNSSNIPFVVVWNKMYRKEIWKELRYPFGRIHEDEFVALDIFQNAKNGTFLLGEKLYYYMQRNDSIMRTVNSSKKNLDLIDALKTRMLRVIDSEYFYDSLKQTFNSYVTVYRRNYKNKEMLKKVFSDYKIQYKKYKRFFKGKFKLKFFLFRYFRFVFHFC